MNNQMKKEVTSEATKKNCDLLGCWLLAAHQLYLNYYVEVIIMQ